MTLVVAFLKICIFMYIGIYIFLVLYFIPQPPKHKATTQKLAKN